MPVITMGSSKLTTAKVELSHPGKLVVATPEQPEAVPTSGTLAIPARSAVVVMEE